MSEFYLPPDKLDLFVDVLSYYGGGIIAGGAVRDALLDMPIKDIDVWVGLDDRPLITETPTAAPGYERGVNDVAAVVEMQHDWCPYPVHVMLCGGSTAGRDPRFIFDHFDYGLCMVAYSLERGLFLTDEFLADAHAHRLSLVHPPYLSKRNRYKRLSEKYAGWEVEAPAEFRPAVGGYVGAPADAAAPQS